MFFVIFNTRYDRQFEVVISRKVFNKLIDKYGLADALQIMVLHFYKPKNKKLSTPKRRRAFVNFVSNMFQQGEVGYKVGRDKQDILNKRLRKKGLKLTVMPRGEMRVVKPRRFAKRNR